MDAWKDGKLYAAKDLTISPYDHGFLYGLGFFETFRTYNGKVFLWNEHWTRLSKALQDYCITLPYEEKDIVNAIHQLYVSNDSLDGYYRLNVSAGVHDIGLQPSSYQLPTVIVFRKPLVVPARDTEKTAVWLETRRNSPENGVRHKSHHFANNVSARLELDSLANKEGFFLTAHGYVAEGITSNIFWVKDGKLFTPSIDTGILAGITRDWILKNAKIEIEVGLYTKEDLELADEVFITNAVQELIPIREIGTVSFLGNQGPVYRELLNFYIASIEEEGKDR